MSNPASTVSCRCGRQTADSHPCHHGGYTCPNEGTRRFVVTNPTPCLAGAQRKATGYFTNACDGHWAEFNPGLAAGTADTSP